MIRKITINNPIDTGSVVKEIEPERHFTTGKELDDATLFERFTADSAAKTLSLVLKDDEQVYGLGETVRGMNKRGWTYTANNSDDPDHTEGKHSLYASQNFFIITDGKKAAGYYVDYPGYLTFDVGYTIHEELRIIFTDLDADIYEITGDGENSPRAIVREFRGLTGQSYIPPIWAFGFGQSRWGYRTEDDVREVADRYEKAGVPLDSIYLDIDYMERYKDFTTDDEKFPDFRDFTAEMKKRGIRLVPIIDAGVKIEKGYDVYEEGVKNGYFCKKENGENFTAAVWPGRVHFPDFLNDDARKWFGDKYRFLLDQGIEGFWNDMNEPAIFYSDEHLKEVFEKIEDYKGKNLDINTFFEFKDLVGTIDNNPVDYRSFYHNFHGKNIRHDKVHNLFGFYMTRAAGEAFDRYRHDKGTDKRYLMFSRSSYIGMHRYGGVWTGDNKSWWSHILLAMQQMPGLNMSGFLYTGSDTAGFGDDTTEDLAMRWTEFSIFTPLFRNHSCDGTRKQEYYYFDDVREGKDNPVKAHTDTRHIDDFRKIVELRYALLPYIYSEFMKAAKNYDMYFRPLAFEYAGDTRAAETEDQLMVGDYMMIAPVYKQNANGRYVYVPEDMRLLRFRSFDDYDEEEIAKGDHYVKAGINETLIFLKKGCKLPFAVPGKNVDSMIEDGATEDSLSELKGWKNLQYI
ncbi:MAG: glycoside hydrolase family 31 protein [Lachnospiraceae bacterium]|nr:alpha-glucosidase [Lachnospiraceae bacterium]MDD7664313.1 glycoside hydrolase family 31 protein [Lachnospiraceae bacterium]MDY4164426.1 glycoside hydrolase family 31 protein [Lachnospiraceae bacterium]